MKRWSASDVFRLWAEIRMGGGLAVRLVLAIVIFSVISTVVITGVQAYFQYNRDLRSINTRFSELRQLQVPVLSESVWVYDEAQIRSQLEAISSLPDIDSARILVDGRVAWSTGKNSIVDGALTERFPLTRDKGLMTIGVLEVAVDMDNVYQRLLNNAFRILLQNAVQTLIIAGFSLVLFQRWVTRHLYDMAEYTRSLGLERDVPDFRLRRAERVQHDILDQLVNALNTMRHNLTSAYQELAAHTAELDESKKKFAAIFHSSPVALSVARCNDHYAIIDVNEAWESQFGMLRDDVVGRDTRDPDFWRETGECVRIVTAVESTGEIWRQEAWRRRGDGAYLLCEISARLFDVGSERLLLLAEEDITEKRRIELEVRELNVNLENRVQERTAQLTAANSELSTALDNLKKAQRELLRNEKLAALGSLVAGVAHELNTPIGNVVMVASTLNQQTKEMTESYASGGLKRATLEGFLEQCAGATDLMLRNLQRASELITSFKRIAVDQTSSQRREFSLQEIVSEVVITLHPTIKKTPYLVEYDIPADIHMDSFPGPLEQVITNMINNSIIHGFEDRPHGTVRIAARKLDEYTVEIRVADDGKGIAPENLNRVFDPFFTTKFGRGGSGLGLNVAHSIVTGALGGTIGLESVVDQGTSFTLTLPLVAPVTTPATNPQ